MVDPELRNWTFLADNIPFWGAGVAKIIISYQLFPQRDNENSGIFCNMIIKWYQHYHHKDHIRWRIKGCWHQYHGSSSLATYLQWGRAIKVIVLLIIKRAEKNWTILILFRRSQTKSAGTLILFCRPTEWFGRNFWIRSILEFISSA